MDGWRDAEGSMPASLVMFYQAVEKVFVPSFKGKCIFHASQQPSSRRVWFIISSDKIWLENKFCEFTLVIIKLLL